MKDLDEYWREMSSDQRFELEKEKLDLEREKLKIENGLDRQQKERIAKKKIAWFSCVLMVPLIVLAVGFGAQLIFKESNKRQQVMNDANLEIERMKEEKAIELLRVEKSKPIRDTIYDTISIVYIREFSKSKSR